MTCTGTGAVIVRAGIGPAMVGPCGEGDSNRGVHPETSDRNDALALDTPLFCDVSALESEQSGVNTTAALVAGDGTSDCTALVAS